MIVLLIIVSGAGLAKASYNPVPDLEDKYNEAQAGYSLLRAEAEKARVQVCETTKELARTKMGRHYSGVHTIADKDVDRVMSKTQWDCSPNFPSNLR